jgi:hypothetical protein
MTRAALVIALTIVGSVAGMAGTAVAADGPGVHDDNHNICVVFAPNQRYTNTTYYCISTPNLPPS